MTEYTISETKVIINADISFACEFFHLIKSLRDNKNHDYLMKRYGAQYLARYLERAKDIWKNRNKKRTVTLTA